MSLKVLQLLPALNHGGVERGTLDLSNYLTSIGYKSIVVSSGGHFEPQIKQSGGLHFSLPIGAKNITSFLEFKKLAQIYLEERPDIIHLRSRFPAWIHFFALRSIKDLSFKPIVISTFHGLYSKPWYSKSMSYVDKTIAISECVREYILKNYNVSKSDIKLIYRGCDTSVFNKNEQDSIWLEDFYSQYPEIKDKKVILFPARVTAWKGIESFGKALSQLAGSDWIGVVAGPVAKNKERYFKKLTKQFVSLIDSKKLVFVGSQSSIQNLYKLSKVTLNLSEKPEPFGRTIIEAAACGSIVIGWNRGGVGESINLIDSWGLVNYLDFKELALKLRSALDGSRNAVDLPEIFTLEYQCKQTVDLYGQALSS